MKRVQYHRFGGPEELQLEDVAQPEPGPDQIRVQVRAAAANPMDWKIRRGEMKMLSGSRFPRGLGHDFAGIVGAVGPGAFAESVIAEEKNTALKPLAISFEQAAALTLVAVTAWTGMVQKAQVSAGQSVFIAGCLGGVGRAAVQIALMNGAGITGSCSAAGREEALALGVSEVVDYHEFDFARYRKRFDVVFDTAGKLSLSQCSVMLKRRGRSLHIVPTMAKIIGSLLSSRHSLVFGNPTLETLTSVTIACERGQLIPDIGRIVPLSEAIPTIVELEKTGLPKGKLVVVPGGRTGAGRLGFIFADWTD
ncbi:NADP-dependent oxidoreductase [Henriciella litoralis]|uniref:NADP-dependent oxidoreductase n=1 Tax=Henriciella litoralis TaxID=568102 RepID=UPI0009FEC5D7|nr:NADP-dependent oxidoreductase [Henriciella litoralis]